MRTEFLNLSLHRAPRNRQEPRRAGSSRFTPPRRRHPVCPRLARRSACSPLLKAKPPLSRAVPLRSAPHVPQPVRVWYPCSAPPSAVRPAYRRSAVPARRAVLPSARRPFRVLPIRRLLPPATLQTVSPAVRLRSRAVLPLLSPPVRR